MQNFLGTSLAIGILAGGFVLTGDLQRLAARGLRVIQSTDVPNSIMPDPDAPIPVADPVGQRPAATAVGSLRPRVAPGPERIDLATVPAGTRVLVWLDDRPDPLPADVVDPRAAAVILHAGTPRRVTIVGAALIRGRPLAVVPLGLAHGGGTVSAEQLGSITALRPAP